MISEEQLLQELIEQDLVAEPAGTAILNSRNGQRNISRLEMSFNQGLIASNKVVPFLKSRVRIIPANELSPDPEAIAAVSHRYASYYGLLPLSLENSVLKCALANPFDSGLQKEIETVLDLTIEPTWAFLSDINEALKVCYGIGAELGHDNPTTVNGNGNGTSVLPSGDQAVRLVNEILVDALQKRATDIHIEPFEDKLKLRYRIDGILYDQSVTESFANYRETVTARLKVLANLNLADKRKPQDGRIRTQIQGADFDIRVSLLPTQYGETVGLRLLNRDQMSLSLEGLGFSETDLETIHKSLALRNGIVLVTGPTGSGKTTTLYNFLKRLNTQERKIVTIEDPIEYQLEGITQLQVNPQIDFDFATGLRSMLRHDPDVMMVGEIRDPETARVAIQVALTGHLVFSTVHTNDSIRTLTRLEDMGVEPFLLGATLECIIAQRLVRCICPDCKRESEVRPADIEFTLFEGAGCAKCNNTGYFGRTGVFEILDLDQDLKDMITRQVAPAEMLEKMTGMQMSTLYQSGLAKAKAGITTYSEVLRVLQSAR